MKTNTIFNYIYSLLERVPSFFGRINRRLLFKWGKWVEVSDRNGIVKSYKRLDFVVLKGTEGWIAYKSHSPIARVKDGDDIFLLLDRIDYEYF